MDVNFGLHCYDDKFVILFFIMARAKRTECFCQKQKRPAKTG